MKSPEDIKKGLECCFPSEDPDCFECPYRAMDNCFNARINDILACIQQIEAAAPKWISVEERLPEDNERVLAVNVDGYMMTGYILCVFDDRYSMTVYYCENGYDALDNVTHWMPLPMPPKEET